MFNRGVISHLDTDNVPLVCMISAHACTPSLRTADLEPDQLRGGSRGFSPSNGGGKTVLLPGSDRCAWLDDKDWIHQGLLAAAADTEIPRERTGEILYTVLTFSMLRLLSLNAQERRTFWTPFKPCHVGMCLKALAEFYQMITHLPGFQPFFSFFTSFTINQFSHQQHNGWFCSRYINAYHAGPWGLKLWICTPIFGHLNSMLVSCNTLTW